MLLVRGSVLKILKRSSHRGGDTTRESLARLELFTEKLGTSLLIGAENSLQIVLKALMHRYAIALENLDSLRESVDNKSGEVV
jgi:hypothetical protein